jgi:hypothetical protein
VKIKLVGHVITFEPPQRLLMLEASRERGGESVRILHASGHEQEEGNFRLVARSPSPSPSEKATDETAGDVLPLPSELFSGLPLLAEFDVWDPPAQYRTLPQAAEGTFDFQRGEQYSVIVLASGTLTEVRVVAE